MLPYITNVNICSTANSAEREDDSALKGETNEPEYISKDYVKPPDMEDVSTENCSKLQEKYDLTKSLTFIPGVSAKAVNTPINNTGCVGGLSPVHIANIMAFVAAKESSSTYDIINSAGYNGRFQFGSLALIDIGFLRPGGRAKNPKDWTGVLSKKLGISSRKQFLECPIAQEIAMQEWIKILWGYLEGTIPFKEMPCDKIAGFIVAAHLLGAGSIRKWYKDEIAKVDGNGVSTTDYFELGVNAANGIFKTNNPKLKSNIPGAVNRGEKYFLYPSVLQNGLGLNATAPVIVEPQPQPNPNPDATDGFAGDMFFKVNPKDIVFYAKTITTVTKVPVLIKEMQEKYGKKNAINCSFFNGTDNADFNVDSVVPPYKDEQFSDMRVKPGRTGVASSFWIKNGVATIGASNAVPSDAKYVVAGKPFCIQNGIPRTETAVFQGSGRPKSPTGRVAIGIYNDGSVFIYAAQKKRAIEARNAILKYANGNNDSGGDLKDVIFLDGGGSPFLYVNNKMIFPNDGRGINNIIAW